MKTRIIEEVEILRAFAIIGVVSIHLGAFDWRFNTLFIETVTIINPFAIPLFILISGFVLSLKYKYDFSLITFYKKRALSIIPPYIIFSFIYILYGNLSPNFPGIGSEITFSNVLFKLITGGASPILWFFIVLIQLYFLYPCLIRLISSKHFKNNSLKFIIYFLLIHLFWNFFKSDLLGLNNRNYGFISELAHFYILYLFLSYLLYFVLGIYISIHFNMINQKIKELKMIYLILFIFPYIAFELFKSHYSIPQFYLKILTIFLQPFFIIAFIIFLYKISIVLVESKNYLNKLLLFIGKYSFGIYLVHFLFVYELKAVFHVVNESYNYKWEFYLFAFIAILIFSIVFLKSITLFPYSNFAVGNKIKTIK